MQTIRFTAELLKGVALLAGTNEVRQYLNGVYIEARRHETRLVATDGKKLGLVRTRMENEIEADTSLIVPNRVLRQIQVRAKPGLLADIVIDGGNYFLRIPEHDLQYGFKPVEGKYIDYARALPEEMSGKAACFDPEQLVVFSKCALALTGKKCVPRITHNGEKAALVTIDGYNDFVGMIMPMPLGSKPADISWFKTVRLPSEGQDHGNPRNATRRGNRPAIAAAR